MKRTKIICTMGPNTNNEEMMRKLMLAGMDIARFNFSHGTHEEQKERMDILKKVRAELKLPVAILLDTKGPEIRTGLLEDGQKVTLVEGEQFILTTEKIVGNVKRCSQTYEGLPEDVKSGDTILIDDGLIQLEVEETSGTEVICRVVNGGELGQQKGINVPNVKVNLPAITEQDKKDILFGIGQGIDFIAASFVRSSDAIKEIKELLRQNGGERIDVIAKVENAEGVENIDRIIKAADGVMVARGDLGVEIPAHKVPHIQKMIIQKCNMHYKPVITATQMLDSMIRNPRPTRAEVTDVANAIYDGTDAIMLSGETAVGKYPEQAVNMMVQIAESTEPHLDYKRHMDYRALRGSKNVSSSVGMAAVQTTENLGADCIITPTMSGQTARLISNFRPKVPIYGVSPNAWARRKMQLYWGVKPIAGYAEDTTENIISHAMYVVKREHLVEKGDIAVFTAGDPSTNDISGEGLVTNIMQIIQVK
ncbi:MAG: pyruvate kinase [Clostridiales bacterium]|nr:pyruvate kinase [Clostridiales bacterium]